VSKFKRITVIVGLSLLVVAGLGAIFGPRSMASVSHMTYREATYSYNVELDAYYNKGRKVEDGILVSIHPERPVKDAPGFSDAYLQTSRERANQWVTNHRAASMDVMIIFSHPLSLEEANEILYSANADVFESGIVGYSDGIPFAGYSKEGGSLDRSLQEIAKLGGGFETEVVEDSVSEAASTDDIRGYLAVRAWVDFQGLETLLKNENVRVVDTTPQEVRDQLSEDRHWQNEPIHSLAIEMPVWAYEW